MKRQRSSGEGRAVAPKERPPTKPFSIADRRVAADSLHYITLGFLGTVGCPLCGHVFPLDHNASVEGICVGCGNVVHPSQREGDQPIVWCRYRSGTKPQVMQPDEPQEDHRQTIEMLCPDCNKVQLVWAEGKQIRGADEGQTLFYQCTVCKREWNENS